MRGRLRLELKNGDGEVIEVRESSNAVMRGGGELIAALFAGKAGAITHMGVGTDDHPEAETYDTPALGNDPSAPLTGGTEAAIPPEAFTIVTDPSRHVVRVSVRATLAATAAVGTLREAGLLSKSDTSTVLYNRVIFSPVNKDGSHELTLFWEITFPYGDLQNF